MRLPTAGIGVYLVEDSPIMVKLLEELFRTEAIRVVGHSAGARKAVLEIDALRPDVVIVDLALEQCTGFDVLRGTVPQQAGGRPAIIVLSNYASPPYREAAKRLGADYFLDKNSEIIQLFPLLESIAKETGKRNRSHR